MLVQYDNISQTIHFLEKTMRELLESSYVKTIDESSAPEHVKDDPSFIYKNPLQRRKMQINALWKETPDDLKTNGKINLRKYSEKKINFAIEIIKNTNLLDETMINRGVDNQVQLNSANQIDREAFTRNKEKLIHALKAFKTQIFADLDSDIISEDEMTALANAVQELAINGDVKRFEEEVIVKEVIKKSPRWQQIIAIIIGAAIGFFAGILLRAVIMGPFVSGASNAILGAILGAKCMTFFKTTELHPKTTDIVESANEVFKNGLSPLTISIK